jgi:hypothetical protein
LDPFQSHEIDDFQVHEYSRVYGVLRVITFIMTIYALGRSSSAFVSCGRLFDSTMHSLVGQWVLEDRRQTARLNLVVSAPSTPVPVNGTVKLPKNNLNVVILPFSIIV